MVLLELANQISNKNSREIVELLCSKTFTLPILTYVLYQLSQDSSSSSSSSKGLTKENKVANDDNPYEKSIVDASDKREAVELSFKPVASDFDWSKQEPIKYRPFKKGEYKLVMGIHNILPEEWFLVENTYKRYTDLKFSYVNDPYLFDHSIFMTEDCIPSVIEFYQESTKFMLQRYPMCFTVKDGLIHNHIRNDTIPLDPYSEKDPKELLCHLSRFLEEDFILMFPDAKNYDTDEFIFKGGVFAFAAGFDPAERFKTPLTNVHGPVPEYRTKLRPQMNKFFDKLKPGVFVKRNNWSIQTHNKVFVIGANKGVEGEEIKSLDPNTLDFKRQVYFRSERQTLTKLPKTGTMVFAIRTYLTPMWNIREEGLGDELIGGIEGMQETIGQYKRRPEWGEPVIKFLKGESDGCENLEYEGLV